MHLDTVCTMVDVDAMVMYPALAATLAGAADDAVRRGDGARACGSGPGGRSCGPRPRRWGSTSCG